MRRAAGRMRRMLPRPTASAFPERMIYRAKTKHPVTGRRIHLRARSERELEAYKHRVESLASELRLGLTSAEDVSRALRRLEHGVVTLERAANAYAERSDLAANTRGRVRALLTTQIAPLAALELVQLDSSVLNPWLEQLRARGIQVTTIATTWRTLRSVIRYAAERGWIGALPWGAWRPTLWKARARGAPREACRSIAELARLIAAGAAVDEADDDLALEPKIAAAGLLGLRQGELAGLRWPDLTRARAPRRRRPRVASAHGLDRAAVAWRAAQEPRPPAQARDDRRARDHPRTARAPIGRKRALPARRAGLSVAGALAARRPQALPKWAGYFEYSPTASRRPGGLA